MKKTEIFSYKPSNCEDPLVVAGGVLLHKDRCLLLKRHPDKPYGSHWNLPAGKVEANEHPHRGAQREIHEETGILIELEKLKLLHVFYIKREESYIEFHIFQAVFDKLPEIQLKLDENIEALWTSHEEALQLPLLSGGDEILKFCLKKSLD
jgi:ADP-ribose pyrophosphatase YjhB (NUDIX family)